MASFKNTRVFTPRSISGLQLWLDAADSSSYTVVSTKVTQWNDKSGNSYHMTPVGTQSNGTISSSFQNNLNVVNFSGRNMYRTPINSAVYPSDCFLLLASKDLARADFFSFGNTTSDNFNSLTLGEHTPLRWHNGSSFFSRTPNTVSPVNETSTGFLIMQWSLANNNYILRRNGSLLTQTASYTYTIGGNPVYQIGYRHTDQTTSLLDLNAYFAEVLVFNSQLSTSQREQIEGYLAWKWGLQANLPSTHPFKNGLVPFSFSLTPTQTKFTQLFEPRSIPGLQMWLDAATSFPTFTNGQAITRWVDKTSNGWVGTAVNSPTYQTNVQNGLPVIRFNGTNQYINFGNILNLGTNRLSIFAVTKFVQPAAISGYGTGIIAKSYYGAQEGRWAMGYDGYWSSGMYSFVVDGANAQASFAYNPGTKFNLFSSVNNRSSYNAIYTNGALSAQTNFSQSVNFLSTANLLFVGVYNNESGNAPKANQYLNGDIGEILVYFTELTTAQRQQIEGYLARKWGISLTATHPNANPLTIAPFSHSISRVSVKPTAKWLPTQVTGCALWLDAADSATVIRTGTAVTQWNDKSGNGRNVTKTSATTNPVYTLNSLNRLPVLANTGTSGLSGTLAVNTLTNMTIFVVCNDTNAAELTNNTGGYVIWWNETGGWGQIQMYISQARLDWRFGSGQAENKPSFNLPSNVSTNYNIACISKSSRAERGFLNGNVVGSYTATNAAIANTSSSFVITGPVGATYATNNIAEIVIYTSTVSTLQRQQVEGYLAWKWGLQLNLPATHPYAKFPPTP